MSSTLWRRLKESGDREARDQLILQFSPLVKFVAGRIRSGLPSGVDQGDLVSDGVIGLMDAIDKFDPDRGLQFQTYAVSRIRGAIVDGLRAADWVPRSVREKIRDITAAQTRLEHKLGRVPTDREVAAELKIPVRELRKMYSDTSHTSVVSFEATGPSDDSEPRATTDLPGGDDDLPEGFLARGARAAGARPDRGRALLLGPAHARRDRPGPRGQRVPDQPAAQPRHDDAAPQAARPVELSRARARESPAGRGNPHLSAEIPADKRGSRPTGPPRPAPPGNPRPAGETSTCQPRSRLTSAGLG